MVKGKILKSETFTAKSGIDYTSYTVMFDNGEVCKGMVKGKVDLPSGSSVEFEPYCFGQNMSATLRPVFK